MSFGSSESINDSIVEFEKYFDQIKAKTSEELKRLTEENSRQTEEIVLFKNKIKYLEESNKTLTKYVVKYKTEFEEMKKSLEEKNKTFNDEVEKNVQMFKQSLENEQKKNEALLKQNSMLNKSKDELNNELNVEKKKNSEFVGLQTMAQELKDKNKSLIKEKNEMTLKLMHELNKKREIEHFKKRYNDMSIKNALQVRDKNKLLSDHKNEVLRLKSSFNQQVIALRRQSYYYKKCNEINKRKHLATQYAYFKEEEIDSSNYEEIKIFFKNLKRRNKKRRQQIRSSANNVVETNFGERVPCPETGCEKTLANGGTWNKHMMKKHGMMFVIQ